VVVADVYFSCGPKLNVDKRAVLDKAFYKLTLFSVLGQIH